MSAHTRVDGVVDKASTFGTEQLMDFRWQLAVGDDTLTDDEISMLAQAKAPLVRLRGQWVAVDSDQLRRGLDFLTTGNQPDRKTAAEILALAAAHADDLDHPASGHRGDGRRLARRVAGGQRFGLCALCRSAGEPAPSCGRTSSRVFVARVPALGASAPAWPTTWASAKRSRPWPCSSEPAAGTRGPRRRRLLICPDCRSSATGRRRPSGSRPTCRCWFITALSEPARAFEPAAAN